ncbi:MAG TPA: hypothetical protein VFA45_05980 [Actinomycetes bacterium]|nr:hypothetical protein [Actinomycetes bacterium]
MTAGDGSVLVPGTKRGSFRLGGRRVEATWISTRSSDNTGLPDHAAAVFRIGSIGIRTETRGEKLKVRGFRLPRAADTRALRAAEQKQKTAWSEVNSRAGEWKDAVGSDDIREARHALDDAKVAFEQQKIDNTYDKAGYGRNGKGLRRIYMKRAKAEVKRAERALKAEERVVREAKKEFAGAKREYTRARRDVRKAHQDARVQAFYGRRAFEPFRSMALQPPPRSA